MRLLWLSLASNLHSYPESSHRADSGEITC
jgi:hypothetical protein